MLISLYDVKCRPEGWRQVRLDSAEPERVLDSQIGALIYECHGCQPAVWAKEWWPMREGRWAALVDLCKIVCRLGVCVAGVFYPIFFANWMVVGRGGLEPPTSRLSGVRSNHLSYRPS